MKKTLLLLFALVATSLAGFAETDLTTGKPVYPLGGYKTWTHGTTKFTNDLESTEEGVQKGVSLSLITTANNSTNVFLLPQIGLTASEIAEQGYQGFYIDLGEAKTVGAIKTTWEGAHGTAYKAYVSSTVPASEDVSSYTEILSVTGASSTTQEYAVDVQAAGRYLIFVTSNCTNIDWGCKIHTLIAYEAEPAVLTSVTASKSFVPVGESTPVTLNLKDQFGAPYVDGSAGIVVTNGTYSEGNLTATAAGAVTITITSNEHVASTTLYAVNGDNAPVLPTTPTYEIIAPMYTSTQVGAWGYVYNGGATLGEEFMLGMQRAQEFDDAKCVFFGNSNLWSDIYNQNINPSEAGYDKLYLQIFSNTAGNGKIDIEGTTAIAENHPFELEAGVWKTIVIDVATETHIKAMSIRMDEAQDLLVSNVFFSKGSTTISITPAYNKTTYVTTAALDFSAVDGLKAYVATAANATNVTMTKVEDPVPAGTPLLLIGTAGTTYNVPVVTTASAPAGNLLRAGDGTTVIGGDSKYDYILYTDGLFYRANEGALAAGKAYLHLNAAPAGARSLNIVFDDEEVTGVNEVRSQKEDVRSEWFDLQGRKVAQPQKGLYIVNGKKIMVK